MMNRRKFIGFIGALGLGGLVASTKKEVVFAPTPKSVFDGHKHGLKPNTGRITATDVINAQKEGEQIGMVAFDNMAREMGEAMRKNIDEKIIEAMMVKI